MLFFNISEENHLPQVDLKISCFRSGIATAYNFLYNSSTLRDGMQCRLVPYLEVQKPESRKYFTVKNFRSWKVPHFTEGCKATQLGGWVTASERNLQLSRDSSTPRSLKLKYIRV